MNDTGLERLNSSEPSEIQEIDFFREIALIAVFTALVFLSTSLFQVSLISSSGYFNLGEAFVYLGALIGGPIVGAVAGGFGSALADIFSGFGLYAPGTFIIKGLEGFFVGYLFHKTAFGQRNTRRILLGGVTLFIISFSFFVITPQLTGDPNSRIISGSFFLLDRVINYQIPGIILLIIAILLSCMIWFIEIKMGDRGRMALACLLAGPIIILGYYLYEIVIINLPSSVALFEMPFNIAQVVFGTFIAVPVVAYLEELGILDHIQEPTKVKKLIK